MGNNRPPPGGGDGIDAVVRWKARRVKLPFQHRLPYAPEYGGTRQPTQADERVTAMRQNTLATEARALVIQEMQRKAALAGTPLPEADVQTPEMLAQQYALEDALEAKALQNREAQVARARAAGKEAVDAVDKEGRQDQAGDEEAIRGGKGRAGVSRKQEQGDDQGRRKKKRKTNKRKAKKKGVRRGKSKAKAVSKANRGQGARADARSEKTGQSTGGA